jgi:hypothetical protein
MLVSHTAFFWNKAITINFMAVLTSEEDEVTKSE